MQGEQTKNIYIRNTLRMEARLEKRAENYAKLNLALLQNKTLKDFEEVSSFDQFWRALQLDCIKIQMDFYSEIWSKALNIFELCSA